MFASESYAQRDEVHAREPENDIVEIADIPKARDPHWIGRTRECEAYPRDDDDG
jgi:hypothetical protein